MYYEITFKLAHFGCSPSSQVFEVLHYMGSCAIKILKLKLKRVKSRWEGDERRAPDKKEPSSQESMRPFLEQPAEKENGSATLLLETEFQKSKLGSFPEQ